MKGHKRPGVSGQRRLSIPHGTEGTSRASSPQPSSVVKRTPGDKRSIFLTEDESKTHQLPPLCPSQSVTTVFHLRESLCEICGRIGVFCDILQLKHPITVVCSHFQITVPLGVVHFDSRTQEVLSFHAFSM